MTTQSPAPELPSAVATPRMLKASNLPIGGERNAAILEEGCKLELELTAEREWADAAHAKFTAEFARADANKRRAERAESRLSAAVALLREHGVAINVWMTSYASDMCDEKDVKKARDIINEGGGTLAYAADLNAKREEFLRGIE